MVMNRLIKSILFAFPSLMTTEAYSQCTVTASVNPTEVVCGDCATLNAFGQGQGLQVFSENFNTGAPVGWAFTQQARFDNPCSPNGVDGTTHIWLGNTSGVPRALETIPYNFSTATSGVTVCFDMLFAVQTGDPATAPCEGPDEPDEGVHLQYSINGGATWIDVHYFDPNGGSDPQYTNWNNWCFQLPPAALTGNTKIRWFQDNDSGADYDHWGIDNVVIYFNDPTYNIIWQHDNYAYGLGNSGGDNPNPVCPRTGTNYIVVMSNGAFSCRDTVRVDVVLPTLSVDAGTDASICAGQCATLDGTGKVVKRPAKTPTYFNGEVTPIASVLGSPTTININITDLNMTTILPGSITGVCITALTYFGIGFPNPTTIGDLNVSLVCPDGTKVLLVPSGVTSSTTPIQGYTNTCFTPSATANIASATEPYTGTFAPAQPLDNLVGCTANGVWSIEIVPTSLLGFGVGSFFGWTISFDDPEISYTADFTWSPASGLSDPDSLQTDACPTQNTNYILTASDTAGCVTLADTVTVTVDSSSVTNVSASICDGDSFFAGGAYQTESGIYYDTTSLSAGCDSITVTDLSVVGDVPDTVTAAICPGDSILLGGEYQTQPGIYTDTFITSSGCDSIVVTILTLHPPSAINTFVEFVCPDDSVLINGEYYYGGEQALDTLPGADVNGCDSIVEILVFNIGTAALIENLFLCRDTTINGILIDSPGQYYIDTIENGASNGCDSFYVVNAIFLPPDQSFAAEQICDGDSIFLGGDFQTNPGTYYDTLTGSDGCDSIVITNLTVLPSFTTNVSVSICDGASYFVGGADQTQSGTYYDTLTASNGCDSIVITELTVLPVFTTNVHVSICEGDSFFADGAYQTQSGIYYDTLTASNGCDSIVATDLAVIENIVDTVAVSICDGESYFAGGGFQTTSGTYYDTLSASGGCDSIVITELTVLPVFTTDVNPFICDGDSFFAGGAYQNQPGIYYDTLTASNGCDSVVITHLALIEEIIDTVSASICEGESYFAGGGFQTVSGFYADTFASSAGCDSIIITELAVLPIFTTDVNASICDGDSFFAGGANQTQPGTYFDTLAASNGCDSIIITDLAVVQNVTESIFVSICDGESYFAGGAFQTESGTYYDTLTASGGCDSIIVTGLTVLLTFSTDVNISICDGDSLFAGGADQTQAGTYYDTLTATNGCDSIIVTNLTVLPVSSETIQVSICQGESHFAGGADQTEPGLYVDTLTGSNGCDSILTTELIVLPAPSSTQNVDICSGESFFAGGAFQTTSGTYYDTLATANGCDSIVITNLTVGAPLILNFDVSELSCECIGQGGGNGSAQPCPFDISGLAHGTRVNSHFTSLGLTITAIPNSGGRPDALIYNTDGNWTEDPDLNSNAGNVIIINENPNNNDGDGTGPDDNANGGTLRFLFDDPVTVVSFVAVDVDEPGAVANAYDGAGNLITSVVIPAGADGSVQTITVNAAGVKRFDIIYRDSGGFRLNLECASPGCEQDLSAFAHGEIVTGAEIAPGVTVTGTSNRPSRFPNAVAIFNSNVTGSLDPDLEAGIGNILILPENLTDNNGNGNIDNPSDASDGGTMTFTFDRDRTVHSITLVDNDRNNGTIKAYDQNNNLLLSVSTPSGAAGGVQTYTLNISGVRRLEVSYWDSRGVTRLILDCPAVNCCDGNATASAAGGFPPYQFSWNTGSTTDYSGDSLCVGTYTVTVTDAHGCSTVDSVSLVRADVTIASVSICEGDSILLGGAYQTETGFYYDTLGVTDSCYQILKTELSILPSSQETVQAQICEGQSYFAGGDFQTESGTYIDTFTAANGCDSVLTTGLTVLPAQITVIEVAICEGESYFAGGAFQTESGTYYDTLVTASGCDSIVETGLTVIATITADVAAQICEGDSFFAGGAFQTESGVYTDTFTSSGGCDSIVETTLSVLTVLTETVDARICEGESYFAGGDFQTESGTYYDTLTSSSGCDSIVETNLTVTASSFTSVAEQICEGDSFFAGGAFQTESGVYADTFSSSGGCDSIVETTLTVLPVLTETVNAQICEGESYFAGGAFQTESGTYYDTITSSSGCDSIVETNLTVIDSFFISISEQICEGDSFFAGGDFQTESGVYTDTFTSTGGCDSIVETTLSVLTALTETVNAQICEGENYYAGGDFQTESGTYYDTLASSSGCDSIVETNLTVMDSFVTNASIEICEGDSFFAGGDFQTESGIYPDTFSSAGGCDSIVITELTVLENSSTFITVEICTSDTNLLARVPDSVCALFDCCCCCPMFLANSVITVDTFPASNGCDSIVTTETVYVPVTNIEQFVTICDGDSFFAGGAFQTTPGTYTDTFTTQSGCDSIVTTELSVEQEILINQDITICEGDSFFAGGAYQTTAGTYADTSIASGGCDSITVTNLTVDQPSITNNDVTICEGDSVFAGGAYQTQAGIYTDTFASSGGCDSIVETVLTVIQLNITMQSTVTTSCFGSSDGELTITVGGGEAPYDLIWSNGTIQQDVGELEPAGLTGLAAGQYGVTATDANGCSAAADITVDEPLPMAVGAVPTPPACNGGSNGTIDLTVQDGTPPYDYLWSTGDTTEDISGRPAGFDTVTVTDANSCMATIIVEVTEPAPIPVTFTDVNICLGDSIFVGGAYQTQSGTYHDTLLSVEGCDSVVATNLNVVEITLTGAVTPASTTGGSDGAIDLTATGGIPPYTYSWSNGNTSEDLAGLSSGQYSVTVADSIGCSATASFFVSQPNCALALGATPDTLDCYGDSDGELEIIVIGGTPPYQYSWSTGAATPDISGLTAGFYRVTVTDAAGCQSVSIVLVSQPDSLALIAAITDESAPGASDGGIDITVSGGTLPYEYVWSNGDTTEDLSGLSFGNYEVTVIDGNGCELIDQFDVNQVAPIIRRNPGSVNDFRFVIYPNPFSDRIFIEFESESSDKGWITMRDLFGRKVMFEDISINTGINQFELQPDSKLAGATYMLEVAKGNGSQRTIRTIVKGN